MEDRAPGTDATRWGSDEMVAVLPSVSEQRAFRHFMAHLAEQCGGQVDVSAALEIWVAEWQIPWREHFQRIAMRLQTEEINKHKWIESEKAHCDVGKAAVKDWIDNHAAPWREWFEHFYDVSLQSYDSTTGNRVQ